MHIEEIFDDIEQKYRRKINTKQRIFCLTFANNFDKARAVKKAGYRTKNPWQTANNLILKPWIKEAIEILHDAYLYEIAQDEKAILTQIVNCAFSDISQCYDEDGELIPVHKLPKNVRRQIVEVKEDGYKLETRKSYMNMLMRYKSLFNDKIQVGFTTEMLVDILKGMDTEDVIKFKQLLDKHVIPEDK